ncbi:MAG: hypothetical protein V4645_29970 [Pseudomonadota bacterium]
MSQTDFFPEATTILRTPVWYDGVARDDHPLPHALGDYKVTPGVGAEHWTVTSLKTNEVVYSGLGPVEVLRGQPAA